MNYRTLKSILKKSCPDSYSDEMLNNLWSNPGKEMPIPEHIFQSGNYEFLTFDYKKHGLLYVSGKIDCCGIRMSFRLAGYDRIDVTTECDGYHIYNYVLIVPNYKPEHWIGKKRISQSASKVSNDKDFIRYKKRVDKRFP